MNIFKKLTWGFLFIILFISAQAFAYENCVVTLIITPPPGVNLTYSHANYMSHTGSFHVNQNQVSFTADSNWWSTFKMEFQIWEGNKRLYWVQVAGNKGGKACMAGVHPSRDPEGRSFSSTSCTNNNKTHTECNITIQ